MHNQKETTHSALLRLQHTLFYCRSLNNSTSICKSGKGKGCKRVLPSTGYREVSLTGFCLWWWTDNSMALLELFAQQTASQATGQQTTMLIKAWPNTITIFCPDPSEWDWFNKIKSDSSLDEPSFCLWSSSLYPDRGTKRYWRNIPKSIHHSLFGHSVFRIPYTSMIRIPSVYILNLTIYIYIQ